jgi:hypothetical protein
MWHFFSHQQIILLSLRHKKCHNCTTRVPKQNWTHRLTTSLYKPKPKHHDSRCFRQIITALQRSGQARIQTIQNAQSNSKSLDCISVQKHTGTAILNDYSKSRYCIHSQTPQDPSPATRETSRNAYKEAAAPQILSKDFGIQPKNWRRMQPRINSQTRNRMLADGLKLFGNN